MKLKIDAREASPGPSIGPTLLFPEANGPTVLIESEKEPNTIKSSLQSTAAQLEADGFC